MSRDPTTVPAGQPITNRTQSSLRDHLNERVAPYLKKALIAGLKNDVEFPLQWLGEHLISLSILYEGNPDTTNIKSHFKYNHDAPPPPAPTPASLPAEGQAEAQPQENSSTGLSNGVTNGEVHSGHTNGTAVQAVDVTPAAADVPAEVSPPNITAAAAHEDTEMHETI